MMECLILTMEEEKFVLRKSQDSESLHLPGTVADKSPILFLSGDFGGMWRQSSPSFSNFLFYSPQDLEATDESHCHQPRLLGIFEIGSYNLA